MRRVFVSQLINTADTRDTNLTKGLLQEGRGQRLHAAHGHSSGVVGAREAMTTDLSADVSEQIEIVTLKPHLVVEHHNSDDLGRHIVFSEVSNMVFRTQ
jgi:hypothetical protein